MGIERDNNIIQQIILNYAVQANQTKLYTELLQAFHFGLCIGIISHEDVVNWADNIIISEEEPDYFFIEITLNNDINELISIIKQAIAPTVDCIALSVISLRAILGLIYQQLSKNIITSKGAADMLERVNHQFVLTGFESNMLYNLDFDEDWDWMDDDAIRESLLDYLIIYQEFNIANYIEWAAINQTVERTLFDKQNEWEVKQKKWNEEYKQRQIADGKKQRQKIIILRSLFYGAALLLALTFVIIYPDTQRDLPLPKFEADLYQFALCYLALFVSYHIVTGINWLLKKVFKTK